MVTTIRKSLPPKEGLSIVSVEDPISITVVNTGDTDLLVTDIVFRSDSELFPYLRMGRIAQIVEARKSKSLEATKDELFGNDLGWYFVGGKSETEWQAFVKTVDRRIVRTQFFSATSAGFQNMNSALQPLNSLPATATLEYVSVKDHAKHKIDMPVLMVLLLKSVTVWPGTFSTQKKPSDKK